MKYMITFICWGLLSFVSYAAYAANSGVVCSDMYKGYDMGGVLDVSSDPFCHGDFILDHIVVGKAQNGDNFLSLNVFNVNEADGVLYVYDGAGQRVNWLLIPGFWRIPDSAFDIFIGNQWNLVKFVTNKYNWSDRRANLASRSVQFDKIRIPVGGKVVIRKDSNHTLAVQIGLMVLKVVPDLAKQMKVDSKSFQDYVDVIVLEAVDPFKNAAFAGQAPDLKEVARILVAIGATYLKSSAFHGKKGVQTILNKTLKLADPVAGNVKVAAVAGKISNSAAWLQNLYYINTNRIDTKIEYIPGAIGVINSPVIVAPSASSQAPKAVITKKSPPSPQQGNQVVFDSTASTDDKDSSAALLVRWDYDGDGAFESGWMFQKYGKWTYTKAGKYNVRLEVKDSDGNIGQANYQLDVGAGNQKNVNNTSNVAGSSPVYLSTNKGGIYQWDVVSGQVGLLLATGLPLTDIALDPAGKMYAITLDSLYRIDLAGKHTSLIGNLRSTKELYAGSGTQMSNASGFDISPSGVGRITSSDSIVVKVDLQTGIVHNPPAIPFGQGSGRGKQSDIWFIDDTRYAASNNGSIVYIAPLIGNGYVGEGIYDTKYLAANNIDGLVSMSAVSGPDELLFIVNNTAYSMKDSTAPFGPGLKKFNLNGHISGAAAQHASIQANVPTALSQPPTVIITKKSPPNPQQGDQVNYDSSASTDDKDSSGGLMVRWDFNGDGSFDTKWVYQKLGKWAYTKPGQYDVRLEVKDSDGNVGSATYTVNVGSGLAANTNTTPNNPGNVGGSVANSASTTMNGVIVGPVVSIQNAQVMGWDMGCGIRVRVQNTTGQIKSVTLLYNAFDGAGNGLGTAMIRGVLTAKATQNKEAHWMDLGGGKVNCQQVNSFKLDANSQIAP